MKQPILPVESIQERDVDLLLLEELSTNNSFCEWLVRELDLSDLSAVNGAWRSVSGFGLGETDILFSYQAKGEKVFVLIENKLDASFQEEQYLRYRKRAERYLNQKDCDQAYVLLIAPERYCEDQNEFESYLTYERIADRLQFIGTKRSIFKSKLLQIACEKLRRGYQAVNSLPVQKFWQAYWRFKEEHYPSFYMKEPGIVPHNSDWPTLKDDRLTNIQFYHKLQQGHADATFKGYPKEIQFKLEERLPDWARLEKHGKSFSIRVFSGKIDRTQAFDEQVAEVDKGLKNLERIRGWILENKSWLEEAL